MSGNTKWTFLVDNKPGANGNIGMDAVAKSKPDGYTIGMGQTANLAINPTLIPKMPFNASKDHVPVALVAELPTVMVVRADSPWKSVGDAVKAAKAKPGEVKQALAGNGTVGHLAGEMLSRQAGIQVLNIPYKGAAPAITDLIGGQTDYMFATPQSVAGMIKGGKLRAIAVTSQKRLSFLPNVPTVAESGYKDFVAMDWKAIVAPAGTPADIVQRLNAEVAKALAQPALVATLEAEGSTPMTGSPEQAAKFIKAEQEKWGSLIREAGIKPD
jgi:tripartite-type tricarboxylate transporter receptor subunit TctC